MHVVMVGAKKAALDALLAAGHEVTVLYEAWEETRAAALRASAKHFAVVDSLASVESLWSALQQIGALEQSVGAVISNSEASVVSAAILGKLLGARSLEPEVALRCRDKAVQKAAWRANGVPCARFVVVPDATVGADTLANRVAERGLKPPFFVKPTAGYGSRRVARANDVGELVRLIADIVARDPSMRRLMIEEGVEGDEWHFDGVIVDGVVQAFSVSPYASPVFETKAGTPLASITLPPSAHGALYAAARGLTERALSALGHTRGVFHLEAFARPGTLDFVAGELAARPGGGASSETIRRTVGVDPWMAGALALTGDEIPRAPVAEGKVYGVLSLPAAGGRINRVHDEHITSAPGVIEVLGLLPHGAAMPHMSETSSACIGYALVESASVDACHRTFDLLNRRVRALNEESGQVEVSLPA